MKRALIKGVINGTKQYNTNWIGVSITDIQVSREATVTRSPIELGYAVMDAKVVQPAEITIKGIIQCSNYDETSARLNRMFIDRTATSYTIITKTRPYTGMMLFSMDESQGTEKYDAVDVTLKFIELMSVQTKTLPKENQNSQNVPSGNKSPKEQPTSPLPDLGNLFLPF